MRVIALFLSLAVSGPAAADSLVTPTDRVTTGVVIRSDPGTDGERLGLLRPGDTAPLLGAVPYWYRIQRGADDVGYVYKAWTKVVQEDGSDVVGTSTTHTSPTYDVYVVDVGTGLAIYARGPDFALVYDAGSQDDTGNSTNRLLSQIQELGAEDTRIDHLIISHPHNDHISLVPDLLERMEVKEIWEIGRIYKSCAYNEMMEAIAAEGAHFHTAAHSAGSRTFEFEREDCSETGDAVTLDLAEPFDTGTVSLGAGASMTFLHVETTKQGNINENSLVVRLNLGGTRVLLTGDAEAGERHEPTADLKPHSVEHDLLHCCRQALRSEVLVIGHHGSMTSSRREFLQAVEATDYIVSSGPFPYQSIKLPDREVLQEINSHQGGRLWCTSFRDVCCKTAGQDKLGPDDDKPGGCNTIHVAIDSQGSYKISGNQGEQGVTDIEHCAHPAETDDDALLSCDSI